MASRFVSTMWKELRHGTIPTKTKLIVCSMILVFFGFTVFTSSFALQFIKLFLITPVNQAQLWHVCVLMLVAFVIFGRNHK